MARPDRPRRPERPVAANQPARLHAPFDRFRAQHKEADGHVLTEQASFQSHYKRIALVVCSCGARRVRHEVLELPARGPRRT